jgi:hypothetical protein
MDGASARFGCEGSNVRMPYAGWGFGRLGLLGPRLNYATRKALFENFMEKKGAKLPDNFPVTTIAHVT